MDIPTQDSVGAENVAGIGYITFFSGKANSLTSRMLTELSLALDRYSADDNVKIICLRSIGKTFCAGASFEEFKALHDIEEATKFFGGFGRVIRSVKEARKLVVAKVQGRVVGGGLGLVAACDYAVASGAAEAKLSEFELGIGPFVVSEVLKRKIGVAALTNMTIDGEWRSAEWLLERGLYSKLITEPDGLDTAVEQLLLQLSARDARAAERIKSLLWENSGELYDQMRKRATVSAQLLLNRKSEGEK